MRERCLLLARSAHHAGFIALAPWLTRLSLRLPLSMRNESRFIPSKSSSLPPLLLLHCRRCCGSSSWSQPKTEVSAPSQKGRSIWLQDGSVVGVPRRADRDFPGEGTAPGRGNLDRPRRFRETSENDAFDLEMARGHDADSARGAQ